MKKIVLILAVLLTGLTAFAQRGAAVKLPLIKGDTIVNTGTASRVITLTGGYNGAVVQVNLALISGTGAGTVQLQQSLDGVNYINLGSPYTITNVASQSAIFSIASPTANYIKVLCTGSGTESVQASYWYRTPLFQTP